MILVYNANPLRRSYPRDPGKCSAACLDGQAAVAATLGEELGRGRGRCHGLETLNLTPPARQHRAPLSTLSLILLQLLPAEDFLLVCRPQNEAPVGRDDGDA